MGFFRKGDRGGKPGALPEIPLTEGGLEKIFAKYGVHKGAKVFYRSDAARELVEQNPWIVVGFQINPHLGVPQVLFVASKNRRLEMGAIASWFEEGKVTTKPPAETDEEEYFVGEGVTEAEQAFARLGLRKDVIVEYKERDDAWFQFRLSAPFMVWQAQQGHEEPAVKLFAYPLGRSGTSSGFFLTSEKVVQAMRQGKFRKKE